MKRPAQERQHWFLVVVFAVGMAWVEAASVYYLREMTDRIHPYQQNPLPIRGVVGQVELVRETATLVMLLALGMVAGWTWQKRLGYTAIAFGFWDIFYYLFLRIICGWPASLFEWDVLFLLPMPWWGPVLAPICIAFLMIVWGTLVTQGSDPGPATALTWTTGALTGLGIALALYVFMVDSLRTVHEGWEATRQVLPTPFRWSAFCVALTLMTAAVAEIEWRLRSRRLSKRPNPKPQRRQWSQSRRSLRAAEAEPRQCDIALRVPRVMR